MNLFLNKHILLFLCYVISYQSLAQNKDSLTPTAPVSKEEGNTLKKRKYIYFVSNRLSDDDKYDVFKATPSALVPALIVIRGHFEIAENTNEKRAKINVYNASNNVLVGTYNTNNYTGNYLLILAPNVRYKFKVESSGYGINEDFVEVPLKIDYEICQQNIKLKLNDKNKPALSINSFFADENEKVFYIKTTADTAKLHLDNNHIQYNEDTKKQTEVSHSSIDEVVKKQIEEENKKPNEALKAFKNNDFEGALTLYHSLLKNDTGEPFVNYYYGICLMKTEKNKAKAINSLKIAAAFKDVNYDVYFYLGKACHLSYLFNDAINYLEEYKKRAKASEIEANNVLQLIQYCKNGSSLITDQVNIEIIKRTAANMESILSNYNTELIGDNLKYKTDFFNSTVDKKRNEKLLISTVNKREYVHVSYGDRQIPNTDLYKNTLLPNGTIGASQTLGIEINTLQDENYPYLTKDGHTLYFSSKGHNSMGGYDIFKCTRKDSVSSWSRPVNMGYPINSTYDDIQFVPDEDNKNASYISNRKNNTYEYTQIKLPLVAITNSIIKGNFSTADTIAKKEAFLTVYNTNTGEIAGVFKTNPITGMYLMILPSGIKYELSVEAENYTELTSSFIVPDKKNEFELKQLIKLQTVSAKKTILLTNYFTEVEASKFSFDELLQKEKDAVILKEKQQDQLIKKNNKPKKARRTAEENAKDANDLAIALKLYEQETYQEAALIYENLNYVIDLSPMDSYYYGMSLYHCKKDKTHCIIALDAGTELKTAPYDIYYYLAKANQMTYRFTTAVNHYKKFMTLCKPDEVKKFNIDQELVYCKNGIKLVNNPAILEVYSKKHVDLAVIQNSMNDIESGGKILVITDDMKTAFDKKKNYNSLIFLTADKNTVLFSSYGDNEENGKDIYQIKKLSATKWTPTALKINSICSPYDEEFPCLSKDGKTLYFSSKGFENMGGYDVFKSEWNDDAQAWGLPINMGAPINSPFDDFYFLE